MQSGGARGSSKGLIALLEERPRGRRYSRARMAHGTAHPPAGFHWAGVLPPRRRPSAQSQVAEGSARIKRARLWRWQSSLTRARGGRTPRRREHASACARTGTCAAMMTGPCRTALTANAMLAVDAARRRQKGVAFAAAGAEAALRARDWRASVPRRTPREANGAEVWSAEAYAEMLSLRNGLMRSHGAPPPVHRVDRGR